MAVKLRLQRTGRHKTPNYRIVAADSRSPRDGRFIEILGTYDPTKKEAAIVLDNDKALEWLKKGAAPSDTVKSLLSKQGVMTKFHEFKNSK